MFPAALKSALVVILQLGTLPVPTQGVPYLDTFFLVVWRIAGPLALSFGYSIYCLEAPFGWEKRVFVGT